MKFISKISSYLRGLKFKFRSSYLWLIATILPFIFILFLALGSFVLHKEARREIALEAGQRAEILLETGEVKGNVAKPQEAAHTDNKTAAKHDANASADAVAVDEQAAEKAKEFAWVHQDFVGPKLPPEVIEALLGDEISTSKLDVASVSIKDISEKPVVIIIIKGMGLSSSSTREALELPKEITMGFSPYSPSLPQWVKQARETGHEVILNIPMETSDYHMDNPGPYSLLTQSADEDNATRLKMLLGLTSDYSAIYSDNNEVFTRSASSVKPVLELLKKENKYFVYGGGYENYAMIQVADSIGYPILVNDVVLDDDISSSAINEKFLEVERIAHEKGYVVVMAHPYPITVRMIKAWLPKLEEKNLVVSPVSLLLGKVFK